MSTTQQQDAPKCTAADGLAEIFNVPGHPLLVRAVDFNRLHAENETLRMGYAAARLEIETLRAEVKEYRHGAGVQKTLIETLLADKPAGEYPALPQSVGDAVDFMDGRAVDVDWSHPAPAGGTSLYSADQMRAYVDADRAMRAAQPAGAQQPAIMPKGESAAAQLRAVATNYPAGHLWDKLDAKACIRGALEIEALRASHGQAPAQDANEYLDLLAQCRSAFPIPERGDPLEVHWAAAMADPGEVPGYLQEIAARHAAQAAPAAVAGPSWNAIRAVQVQYAGIVKAAVGLLAAVDDRHDSDSPIKYTIPYGAVNALRDALTAAPTTQPAPRHQARINGDSAAPKLRAMATNYPAGHQWDKLDAQACIRGALEIEALRSQAPQPSPAAQGDALDAERWRMAALVGNEVMVHPDKRNHAAAVAAYMQAVSSGLDLTAAIDAARAAQEGK